MIMERKKVKLLLLLTGAAVFTAGAVMFIINSINRASQGTSGFYNLMNNIIVPFYVSALISIVPLSIASLMHSNDIRETKRNKSNFLRALSFFWMIGGVLSAAALIFITIIF